MDISDVQRQFTAYGHGQLPESELRSCIRAALSAEPGLSPTFIALADAYCRAHFIDDELRSTIVADIAEITAPKFELTRVRPGAVAMLDRLRTSPTGPGFQGADPVTTRPGSTTGSAWDTAERLSEVASPLFMGSVLRERFELVQELGRGGMGIVYRAFDRRRADLREPYVAIKVLNEEFKRHPLAVRALQRESRKAQKLAHPNIVAVHDFDRDGGNVYMVMELLSGHSLDEVIRSHGKRGVPLSRALAIIEALGSALSHAHELEIIHSDFKPSNAFLTAQGKVKVLDFGIARAAPSRFEMSEKTTLFDAGKLGALSAAYASPEMLRGEEPDIRDDVYALACVAYELLTGVHPFKRIDALKASESRLRPARIRSLSRAQWRALKQALAFERSERTASVENFVTPLLNSGKRPKILVACAALLALAVPAVGFYLWQWPMPHFDWREFAAHVSLPGLPGQPRRPEPRKAPLVAPAAVPVPVSASAVPEQAQAVPLASAPTSDEVQTVPASQAEHLESPAAPQPMPQDTNPPETVAAASSLEPGRAATDSAATEAHRVRSELLKEQLESQAGSGDIEGAGRTAAELRRVAVNAEATRLIPQLLMSSYLHRAQAQFTNGEVDGALKTLAEGRRKFGRSSELKNLEARYVADGDVYDQLRSAVTLNAATQKQQLDALRTSDGEDYQITEHMLAQTLANRIADLRAKDHGSTVADGLLASGQKLFPDYANLLTEGRAGVLPSTPVMVVPEETEQAAGGSGSSATSASAPAASSAAGAQASGEPAPSTAQPGVAPAAATADADSSKTQPSNAPAASGQSSQADDSSGRSR